jgi:hypothetical protein
MEEHGSNESPDHPRPQPQWRGGPQPSELASEGWVLLPTIRAIHITN